jgi:uncharacterized protein
MKFMVNIEVVYASPNQQKIITVRLAEQSTVIEAIEMSGILKDFTEIDLQKNKVGIWGTPCALSQTLQDKDRVEIYRPLKIDPKEARKKRGKA